MAETETELLRTMVEQQRRQLEIATEAIDLQRRQFERAEQQFERAERIQARAEVMQARGARLIRIILGILVPLVLLLAVVTLMPQLRYFFWLARH